MSRPGTCSEPPNMPCFLRMGKVADVLAYFDAAGDAIAERARLTQNNFFLHIRKVADVLAHFTAAGDAIAERTLLTVNNG